MRKIVFNSPAILSFAIVCFMALVFDWLTAGFSTTLLFSTYQAPLSDPFTWIRFIGHVFGHSGWEHFFNNIIMLLIIGPLLEEKYGTVSILCAMFITAMVTGLIHFICFPGIQLLGASGVVYALILMSSITSIREHTVPLTFILVAVFYVGQEIWQGLFAKDNISNLSHIIGSMVGVFAGWRMKPHKE